MTNGTLVLNGITDQQLEKIVDFKTKHESEVAFDPGALRKAGPTSYNNAAFSWTNDNQFKVVLELVSSLLA